MTASAQDIRNAVQILAAGELVAFPTETVYGLGGDAESNTAIRAIYAAKGRPAHNPLIVHVADITTAGRYGELNTTARRLAKAFWPGPLTLVVQRTNTASPLVSAGGETIALRVPAHPLAQSLLHAFGRGIAAPSANRSGHVSPTCAAHVAAEFAAHPQTPAMILDGGATPVGIESTVLDCTAELPALLRPGSITSAMIGRITPLAASSAPTSEQPRSPGQLESHYAPTLPVRLNAGGVHPGEALLAFGPPLADAPEHMLNLSKTGNLEEAAANLYACLRVLDRPEYRGIAVMPVPVRGIGAAINDRLQRAAAPRPPSHQTNT